MALEHLWAGWRGAYVAASPPDGRAEPESVPAAEHDSAGAAGCVFCRILASGLPDSETHILWRGETCLAILNAYPYTSGHLMVMPNRHVADLDALDPGSETPELWAAVTAACTALRSAYRPEGINVGANLGRAAGAGVPGHLHVHVLPRWLGDTNFATTVAGLRVMPEALDDSAARLRERWPA